MNALFYTPAGEARWQLSWSAVLLATLAVASRLLHRSLMRVKAPNRWGTGAAIGRIRH